MSFLHRAVAQSPIIVNSPSATVQNDGNCTINEAIVNANEDSSVHPDCPAGNGTDRIEFNIPGQGPHTISMEPGRELVVTESLVIDGLSQPGNGGAKATCGPRRNLLIELDGSQSGRTNGISILNTDNVVVRGLTINSFNGSGIHIFGSTDILIQCNQIGTNAGGNIMEPNGDHGIQVADRSSSVIIGTNGDGEQDRHEFNVISGNGKSGIVINDSHDNIVAGNRIGTDISGIFRLGNTGIGIQIYNGSQNNLIGTNSDGIADDLERNTISGNGNHGISLTGGWTRSNIIAGNNVGTNVFGSRSLPNAVAGINVTQGAKYTRIGGPRKTDGNVISGNTSRGIWVQTSYEDFSKGFPTSHTTIQNNYIGVDVNRYAMGNNNQGILLTLSANNLIMDNIIAENSKRGIYIIGAEAVINNNVIKRNGLSGIEVTYFAGRSDSPEAEARNPDDVLSSVSINGNAVRGNCNAGVICAGILGLDDHVDPNNPTKGRTLAAANFIDNNYGKPDIAQYWYAAASMVDVNTPVAFTLDIRSNRDGPTYSLDTTVLAGARLDNLMLRGPQGFSSTNLQTWQLFLDFVIDEDGNPFDYSLITAGGAYYQFDVDAATLARLGNDFRGQGIVSRRPHLFTVANDSFSRLRYRIFQMELPFVTLTPQERVEVGSSAHITATLNMPLSKDVVVALTLSGGVSNRGRSAVGEETRILIPAGSTTATTAIEMPGDAYDFVEPLRIRVRRIRNAYGSKIPMEIEVEEPE